MFLTDISDFYKNKVIIKTKATFLEIGKIQPKMWINQKTLDTVFLRLIVPLHLSHVFRQVLWQHIATFLNRKVDAVS